MANLWAICPRHTEFGLAKTRVASGQRGSLEVSSRYGVTVGVWNERARIFQLPSFCIFVYHIIIMMEYLILCVDSKSWKLYHSSCVRMLRLYKLMTLRGRLNLRDDILKIS